ncbi:MAG: energy transducer TonB [Vicinamibacterales bacterium]
MNATSRTRILSGTGVHLAAAVILVTLGRLVPDKVYDAVIPTRLTEKLVWLAQPGAGGGGGGGNRSAEPRRRAELKGQQQMSVPAAVPPQPTEPDKIMEPQVEQPAIAAQPLAAAAAVRPGDIGGPVSIGDSRGRGDGPGAGNREGPGAGSGEKPGFGDGPYQAGNGVLPPRVRRQVDPQYTADAMRAKIQGTVLLSAVVLPDGSVTDIRVLRSLDRTFGLDGKAIEAARQWRFFPGTRYGEPVPVLVNIELVFNVR